MKRSCGSPMQSGVALIGEHSRPACRIGRSPELSRPRLCGRGAALFDGRLWGAESKGIAEAASSRREFLTPMKFAARVLLGLALLLLAGGVVVGVAPVHGTFESEDFTCGSPFRADRSQGYDGSPEFAECDSTRRSRAPLAAACIAVGSLLAASSYAATTVRRRSGS